MFVVDHASLSCRRNHFARAKIGFVFDRKAHEFIEFLGGQEFIQDHALRRQDNGPISDSGAGLRNHRCTNRPTGWLRLTGWLWLTGSLQRGARGLGLSPRRLRLTRNRCGSRLANARGLRLTGRLGLTRVRTQFRIE